MATLQRKRKIIDLRDDTFRSLSVMAASRGTNLKNFIEVVLNRVAEDYDESKQYAWLTENIPEGKEKASEEEKRNFENWLGV